MLYFMPWNESGVERILRVGVRNDARTRAHLCEKHVEKSATRHIAVMGWAIPPYKPHPTKAPGCGT
jgi:hypothetical protein